MAYVLWHVLMQKYTQVRTGLYRNPNTPALVAPQLNKTTNHEQSWKPTDDSLNIVTESSYTLDEISVCSTIDVEHSMAASTTNSIGRNETRRSKSKVRSYLKRCKNALIGLPSSSIQSTDDHSNVSTLTHEPISQEPSTSLWYLKDVEPSCNQGNDEKNDTNKSQMQSSVGEMVLLQSVGVDMNQNGTNIEHENECHLEQLEMERDIKTLDAVMENDAGGNVQSSENSCGVANLVDRYLGHLYPDYIGHTRTVLVRQARDILVCTFHGDLGRFENDYLQPAAVIVDHIKEICHPGSLQKNIISRMLNECSALETSTFSMDCEIEHDPYAVDVMLSKDLVSELQNSEINWRFSNCSSTSSTDSVVDQNENENSIPTSFNIGKKSSINNCVGGKVGNSVVAGRDVFIIQHPSAIPFREQLKNRTTTTVLTKNQLENVASSEEHNGFSNEKKALFLKYSVTEKILSQNLYNAPAKEICKACGNQAQCKKKVLHKDIDKLKMLSNLSIDINNRDIDGNTLLHLASKKNDLNMIKKLVKSGANVFAKQVNGLTALHVAVYNGNKNCVKFFLQLGISVNIEGINGLSLLHVAAQQGCLDMIKYLIKKGADVFNTQADGWSALHFAVFSGNLQCINHFLELGIDVNISSTSGFTPLHAAAKIGNTSCINHLIKMGSDQYQHRVDGVTAMHFAAFSGMENCVKHFLDSGFSPNIQSKNGYNLLHAAAQGGHLEMIEYLISIGHNIFVQRQDGWSALHFAALSGNKDCVQFLLESGFDVNQTANIGFTSLHAAAAKGHMNIIEYLITKGAYIFAEKTDGSTVLHYAAFGGNENCVKFFIDSGIDVNCKTTNGYTPLHAAAKMGHLNVIKCLIRRGAKIMNNQCDGVTALHYAASSGNEDCVNYFIQNGFNVDVTDYYNRTPLHAAAEAGHIKVIEYLIEKNANVFAKRYDGATALHFAAISGNLKCMKLLIDLGIDINCKGINGFTPLHAAAEAGELKSIKYLIANGANISARRQGSFSVLDIALVAENEDCVEFLKKFTVSISKPNNHIHPQSNAFINNSSNFSVEIIKFSIIPIVISLLYRFRSLWLTG